MRLTNMCIIAFLMLSMFVAFALGVSVYPEETVASTSLWVIIAQLLTASLPDVNPIVNFLIAIPFWVAISFWAFTIMFRMMPFVGGG